ncbi:hypothetical protein, partial [Apilactobacillus xinyiensis]
MQFNKKQFKKENEKKILKKVKKEWVVVSIATLMMCAGGGLTVNQTMIKADETSNSTKNESGYLGDLAEDDSDDSSSSDTTNDEHTTQKNTVFNNGNQKSENNNDSFQNSKVSLLNSVSDSEVSKSSENSSELSSSKIENSELTDGSKNAIDNNLNSQEKNVDNNINENSSNNENNLNTQMMKPSFRSVNSNELAESKLTENQSLAENSDEYKYAVKGVSDAMAGGSNVAVTQPKKFASYYNAGYQGVIDAQNKYNEATQNYGTNDSYSSFDDSKTDNPNDAENSAKEYEQDQLSKLNTVGNYSVENNNGKPLVIPNKNNLDPKNIDTSDSKQMQAYAIGASTFLANQGAKDAKSGKWNGIVKGGSGNSTTTSIYNPDTNSTNPYDQAYLGAISAMNAQWNKLSNGNETYTVGNKYSYTTTSDNKYFQIGVDSVVQEIKAGTIFANNGVEAYRAMFGNTSDYNNNSSGNFDENIKSIKFTNDIFFNFAKYSAWNSAINSLINKSLSIDGQNHIYDPRGQAVQFNSNENSKLEIKNFKTMYGYNYFGNFRLNNKGDIYFSNVNYVGSQFISAPNSNVYLSGNINSYQTSRYYSPFDSSNGNDTQSNNEELFEINNMTVQPGANFYGRVSEGSGKSAISLSGTLSLGNNSKVTVVNRGSDGSYGIRFSGTSTKLNILNNAHLNIIPSKISSVSEYGSGVYSGDKTEINIDGGKFNIEINGNSSNTVFVASKTRINVYNKGHFILNQSNSKAINSNVTTSIYMPNGSVNIANQSLFKVTNIGSNKVTLYNVANTSIINSTIIIDASKNTNDGTGISSRNIIAYSANYRVDPDGSYLNNPFYKMSANTSKNISYTSAGDGKTYTQNNAFSKYLEIIPAESISLNGPVNITNNTISGYLKVYNNNPKLNIYAQFGYYDQKGNLIPLGTPSIKNEDSKDSDNYYTSFNGMYDEKKSLPNSYLDGQNIPFIFKFDKSKIPNNAKYGILLRYGTSIVTSDVSNDGYNVTLHGYDVDKNGNINNQINITLDSGTNSNDLDEGQANGLSDKRNNSHDQRDVTRYGSNAKYTNAYDSVVRGYQAYLDNKDTKNDPNINSTVIPNDDTPISYIYGYNAAKSDAKGYEDGENDFKNSNPMKTAGDNNKAYYDNYLAGYNDFKAGYDSYLNHDTLETDPNQTMLDGINYAANAAQAGANKAINNGDKISDSNNNYTKAFNQGYDSALLGVLSFDNFNNPNISSNTNNKEYDLGFNSMKEYAEGYQKYLSSPNEYDSHKAMSTNLDAGYVAAYNANQDVQKMVAPGDDTKNQNIMYQTIYYKAYYNAAQNTFNDNDKHVNDSMQAVDNATNTATKNNTNAQQASDTANKTSVKTNSLAEKYPNNPTISSANQKAQDAATSASDAAKQAADAQSNAINASNAAQKAFDSYQAASQAASDAISEANSYANAANSAAQLGDVDSANKAHEASKQASQKVADALNKAKTAAEEVNKQNTIAQDAANTANTANNNAQTAQDNAAKALDEAQKEANKIDQVYTDGNKAADDAKNKNNQINGMNDSLSGNNKAAADAYAR